MTKFLLILLFVISALPSYARTISDPADKSLPHYSPGKPNNTGYLQCKDGEYAVVAEDTVPKGGYALTPNPECGNQDAVRATVDTIRNAMTQAAKNNVTGAIKEILGTKEVYDKLTQAVGAQKSAEIDALFGGTRGKKAAVCYPIAVNVQPGAILTGYALMALNHPGGEWLKCAFGSDAQCGKAWMSFPGPSYILSGNRETGQTVTVIFKNWKHDWEREVKLVVFFKLPAGDSLIEAR